MLVEGFTDEKSAKATCKVDARPHREGLTAPIHAGILHHLGRIHCLLLEIHDTSAEPWRELIRAELIAIQRIAHRRHH